MPTPGPQSVDRALEILDAVADADTPLTAKALARRLGCSLSTVYHLLGPLTARGHVVRAADGGYAPGPRAAALHRSLQRHMGLTPGVPELLGRLRRATGAEAYFTAYRDGRITVVDTTAPLTDTGHPFTPGPEPRAHATAHGKALLAGLDRTARRRYLTDHGMARFTHRTITSADRFEAEMRRVRAGDGVAVSVGEADPAYTCLAVRLRDGGGHGPLHALSLSVPTARFRHGHGALRQALREAVAGFPTLPER
ncbi:helix-turn-helix domain-containing protein [Streptomyces sp. MUM 203J]|uniref:IclR family transcriptional regulator n=1 Tax=Streptomyces sp. MUM 203J TaxID=2791990 RepID=UPI001F04908A|nr:IclR family transcriptional regulator C-terminal domain-containing protein [Streptomyces sp. MUM 203J]MCH0542359.1 helix-turn-helix domain-containing protein [Streptomyces sp. MUM 203J]